MADQSKISWTDHTFNPWMGCQKVTHECDHCYAETLTTGRMGLQVFGGRSKRKRTSAGLWKRPAKWNRESAEDAKRRSAKYGEAEDAEHEHRGFGAVRRRPESDLPKGPSNE